jgi:hypothetical protein
MSRKMIGRMGGKSANVGKQEFKALDSLSEHERKEDAPEKHLN